ncbi:MAG: hypothetical protein QM758_00875 [Armatimonas sp.]
MAYYPDLSPYTYHLFPRDPSAIEKAYPDARNIGWLDNSEPFPQWDTPPDALLLKRLLAHTILFVMLMRGYHRCQWCSGNKNEPGRNLLIYEGHEILLDNGEILVVGTDGVAFRAPVMLYHYITEHRYNPPRVFWDALQVSSPALGFDLEDSERTPFSDQAYEKGRQEERRKRRAFALQLL